MKGKNQALMTLGLMSALLDRGYGIAIADPVERKRPQQSEEEKAERIRRAEEKRARRAAKRRSHASE